MAVLPGVEEVVKNVCEKFVTSGVFATSDVEFIESKSIEEVLPVMQCRKLIQYFFRNRPSKTSSKTVEHNTQPIIKHSTFFIVPSKR